MSSPPDAGLKLTLERIMDESLRQANDLLHVLQDERQALENRDAAALGIAADGKRKCVARLEALEADRQAASEACRAEANNSKSGEHIADRWQQFLTIVGRCSELNSTNGAIIRLRRQQIADAVKVIGGCATETYGPSGAESLSRAGRALAAA